MRSDGGQSNHQEVDVASEEQPMTVLLETINPQDLTPDDLQVLADQLGENVAECGFEVAYEEQHGAGVTWHEVLRIWVPEFASLRDNTYSAILGMCVAYMRQRFKRKRGGRRPKSIIVHDAKTGKEIASYVISDETSEPIGQVLEVIPRRRPKGRHRKANG